MAIEYLPALQVGGDYAFVGPLATEQQYLVVAADVSGHGIKSALLSSRLGGEIGHLVDRHMPMTDMLVDLNRSLSEFFLEDRLYLTLLACVIDCEVREIRFINCGHTAGLLWSAGSGEFERLSSHHFPIGLFDEGVFGSPSEQSVSYQAGDKIVLYSDGVTELETSPGVEVGESGLLDLLRPHLTACETELAASVFLDLIRLKPRAEDDRLLLCGSLS